MIIDRRTMLRTTGAASAFAAMPSMARTAASARQFPDGFIWGASTSGHQTEGNDTASDTWFLGTIAPTAFAEPVGDAANSFHLWPVDLDLCVALGLTAYRFSVEWSRIEPVRGLYSRAMLDHYERMVDGCLARGLKPIVTLNHFTSPRWFAEASGWLNPQAPEWFAAYCEQVVRAFGNRIDHVITFNEPNLPKLLSTLDLPPQVKAAAVANLDRATALTGSDKFVAANVVRPEDIVAIEEGMRVGHQRARAAIKAIREDLPVGLSVAIFDDQAAEGGEAMRERMRKYLYGAWLEEALQDDYLGVQNYERAVWGPDGRLPSPEDGLRGLMGAEVYPASLAGAVRYAHAATGKPIMVTEHGVGTENDDLRAWLIPEALRHLHAAVAEGVPVTGYFHWSLLDNFEWTFGYGPKFGLYSVDRTTFARTHKPSAAIYAAIAGANAV